MLLVVDDSDLTRKMLCRIMKAQGFDYEEAEDGAVAVEKVFVCLRVCTYPPPFSPFEPPFYPYLAPVEPPIEPRASPPLNFKRSSAISATVHWLTSAMAPAATPSCVRMRPF